MESLTKIDSTTPDYYAWGRNWALMQKTRSEVARIMSKHFSFDSFQKTAKIEFWSGFNERLIG